MVLAQLRQANKIFRKARHGNGHMDVRSKYQERPGYTKTTNLFRKRSCYLSRKDLLLIFPSHHSATETVHQSFKSLTFTCLHRMRFDQVEVGDLTSESTASLRVALCWRFLSKPHERR